MSKGVPKLKWNEMTNDEILQVFKGQYYKFKPKDATEYKKKINTPSLYILRKRLNLSWNQALVKIGVNTEQIKYNRNRDNVGVINNIIKNK